MTVVMNHEVADKVRAWLTEGEALRTQLVTEKQSLLARVREIDSVLSAMPPSSTPAPAGGGKKSAKDVSAPEIVKEVLTGTAAPMNSTEILEMAQMLYSNIDERNIHSALYRLGKRGVIQIQGSKGSMKYSLRKAA